MSSAQDEFGTSSDISWHTDETTVDATLVRPLGEGRFPGVVMVAGSGPTDRDWNSPLLPGTNGSASLIANALARAGFASLRYDKRVVGPHAAENLQALMGKLSMRSHLDEVAGAVHTLAGQDFVRADRIIALTNSEGALHALNYQTGSPAIPFSGLVLIAPPGRAVGDVARAQLAAQAASIPNGDEIMALYDAAITRFLAGEPIAPDPAMPPSVQQLLLSLATPVNLPFARELWMADAATPLTRVDVPTLVIIGKKDIQIDWQADGEALERAVAGRANVTFLYPENVNHVFKLELRPRSGLTAADVGARYNAPDAQLDPDTVTSMLQWLKAHV
ncbi:MAG TPA: alpha/beta hydrolase [Ktedonobacterales bacterium]|nr:alpha/beta hydrolase [Ktedonobacterales bacterium]